MSGSIAQLLWTLKRGSPEEQARAGHQIYQLESMGGHALKNDASIVTALVDQEAIPLATELMSSAPPKVQEAAALILRPICQNEEAYRQKVLAAGVLPPLLKLLSLGPQEGAAHYAAGLVVNLSFAEGFPRRFREAGSLPFLFQIIQDPSAATFGKYQAIDALGWLAKFDEETARVALGTPGLPQLLVAALDDTKTAAAAANAVGWFGYGREWAVEILQRHGAIAALIKAFDTTDDDQLDRAVHALLQLASRVPAVRPAIVEAGGLEAIVGVLEKGEVPGHCVQSCAACIVYWIWQQEEFRRPIYTSLVAFVEAVESKIASPVEAEAVVALQGLHYLVNGQKFDEPEISTALVHAGALAVVTSAVADPRADVKALGIQILQSLASFGNQQAARDALSRIDLTSPLIAMMQSTDSKEREKGAELVSALAMYEERTDAWWSDPPNIIRPRDVTARRLVDGGALPVCLHLLRDPTEGARARSTAALAMTRFCCYRAWGQLAMLHTQGIPATIEVLLRPDTPAELRKCCAYLLKNAVNKHEQATWAFVQAGGPAALFQAIELTEKGDLLQSTLEGLTLTLRSAWEITPTRPRLFVAIGVFMHRIEMSKTEPWERRERLFQGLFTAVDPDLNIVEASLQDAFIQAGAFTLLIPMLASPVTAAQVWAANTLRGLVIANQATKRTLNDQRGLTLLFEALKGGHPEVQEAVLKCLGEELFQAGELSALAVRKMDATKLLSQCILHGETRVQEKAMWVVGRMALDPVTARLMGQEKPRRLMSLLIEKAKGSADQPRTQFYAVFALEFLSAVPEENVKLALKAGLVPVLMDIVRSAAAEDRARVRALSTLTDNSRAYYKFKGKCSRAGIYKVTWRLKDDPDASPAVREAAAKAYKDMWKALGEGFFRPCFFLSFSMRQNILVQAQNM